MSDRRPEHERPPLEGRTVVVTRPREQAEELGALLEREGAGVRFFPMIRIVPPTDVAPLQRAARDALGGAYDWVIFTSSNAVVPFARALGEVRQGATSLTARVAAVGPATAAALADVGIPVDLVPESYVGEGVLEALERAGEGAEVSPSAGGRGEADDPTETSDPDRRGGLAGTRGLGGTSGLAGKRILLPRAAQAREVLPEGLRARGATVDVVEAYRNVPEVEGAGELRRLLAAGQVDIVTFTSSSTVRSFQANVGAGGADDLGGAVVAAIGPITARTAREAGFSVEIVADPYTAPALVEACVAWARAR